MRGSQIFQEIHSIANTAALTVQLCRPPLRGFDCALQIRTRNVNLDHICLCHSVSYYEPAAADPTRNTQYYMAVSPNEDCLPRPSGGEATMEWKVEGRWPLEWTVASTEASGSAGSQENWVCRQCGACWVTPVGTEPPQPSTRTEEPATGDETDLGQVSSSDPEA